MRNALLVLRAALLGLLLAGWGSVLSAQPSTGDRKSSDENPEMSADQLRKMMALMMPGEHHKPLNRWVGEWNTTVKLWAGADTNATVSAGKATYAWILNGRYVQSKLTGQIGGMPFEGMGIDGYDNAKEQYFSLSLDNLGTGYMMLTGQATPDGKSFRYTGAVFDPDQNKDIPVREDIQWLSDTTYVVTTYTTMQEADGKAREVRTMQVTGEKE